ncbi:TPA: translation initiation factor [Candidatus Woesearchaeota archaeon]|nr:translation initiation factor [Candidatus Woesearchaeota archaeon]HII68282.1 translation initiation factor [Candidatus Woesearchaeota archaeon]
MPEIDPITGLPKELGTWENLAKESQKIIVRIEKKKFNKYYTVIEGIDQKEIDIRDITKSLKSKLACGGTIKDGKIELQGDHRSRMRDILNEVGFAPETIELH